MLIRALATFQIELEGGRQLMLQAHETADVPGGLAQEAIRSGAAVAATLEELAAPGISADGSLDGAAAEVVAPFRTSLDGLLAMAEPDTATTHNEPPLGDEED